MVLVWGARQGQRRLGEDLPVRTCPFLPYFPQAEQMRPPSRDDDDVGMSGHETRPASEALAAEPFHTVALDGPSHLARGHDPEPRGARPGPRLGRHEEREMRSRDPASHRLDAEEVLPPADAAVPRERLTRRSVGRGCHGRIKGARAASSALLLVDLRSEPEPALATPVRQDLAAPAGLHAGAEAVGPRPADIVGLVGALHEGGETKHSSPRRSSRPTGFPRCRVMAPTRSLGAPIGTMGRARDSSSIEPL